MDRVLPLLGILESALLPGETRAFVAPAIQAATARALVEGKVERLVALGITSRVELPALASSRWGTECVVVDSEGESLTLRGERRVRLVEVRGRREPYEAVIVREAKAPDSEARARKRAGDAAAVLMALSTGFEPERADWPEQLEPVIAALIHAVTLDRGLAAVAERPSEAMLPSLAEALGAHKQAREALVDLEETLSGLASDPAPDKAARHALWSKLVAIQRRLNIYDPMVPDDASDEIGQLQRKLSQAGLPSAARQAARREFRLLRGTSKSHHDYTVHLRHLKFISDLPWHPEPEPDPDLEAVRAHLEANHHGLEEPKRRVLEYLAVRALGGKAATTVLCLAGPPGTGKTSIARSVAEALGRPFVRISLGGMHDESELRGHRISYVAASPGRLLEGVARAGSMTAVVLLDELDKVATRTGRSPVGALLEILDPEQNHSFRDNYLGFGYDLSNLFFIATANQLDPIPEPLRDRLEIIELDGYTVREKTTIAQTHLLPALADEHGLGAALEVDGGLIRALIEGHTKEAGIRQLKQRLATLHRDRALKLATGREQEARLPLSPQDAQDRLGSPRYRGRERRESLPVGVACGLSVSGHTGGALIFIEVGRVGDVDGLEMTGRLGDVMRESVHTALAHLRLCMDGALAKGAFHVHVPDAATAKDGPSAGLALFAAFWSIHRGQPLRSDLAMTGELSLMGDVLPVGGVRAKLLAAERAGIATAIIPKANLSDVPKEVALEIIAVQSADEALEHLFATPTPRSPRP